MSRESRLRQNVQLIICGGKLLQEQITPHYNNRKWQGADVKWQGADGVWYLHFKNKIMIHVVCNAMHRLHFCLLDFLSHVSTSRAMFDRHWLNWTNQVLVLPCWTWTYRNAITAAIKRYFMYAWLCMCVCVEIYKKERTQTIFSY